MSLENNRDIVKKKNAKNFRLPSDFKIYNYNKNFLYPVLLSVPFLPSPD